MTENNYPPLPELLQRANNFYQGEGLQDTVRAYADAARAPLLARIAELEQKNAEILNEMTASNDARDAQRYRWLLDKGDWYAELKVNKKDETRWELAFYTPKPVAYNGLTDDINAAVDAAIAQDSHVCDCQEAGVECQHQDNWRQYATADETTAQQVIERHRKEQDELLNLLTAARRDAQRYQWLRDVGDATWEPLGKRPGVQFTHEVDNAIDAAISKESK